jgi:hypothetical protein
LVQIKQETAFRSPIYCHLSEQRPGVQAEEACTTGVQDRKYQFCQRRLSPYGQLTSLMEFTWNHIGSIMSGNQPAARSRASSIPA